MNIKNTIFIYLVIILLLFVLKPELFVLDVVDRKRKLLYLFFLIVIISIIAFYFKVLNEWFFC